MPIKVNDKSILKIQEILRKIEDFKYEEAFLLSSEIIERKENSDQLFHEWVKALAEFFACNKRNTAIKLLEKIEPCEIENEIHFNIINALICFYRNIGDKESFIQYKNKIYFNLDRLDNSHLKQKIVFNIANGFYTFEDYEKALKYSEESIVIARENNIYNICFSLSNMIKIMSLFYLGKTENAQHLKQDFLIYLKITDNIKHKNYLDKALERFYKEGGKNSEIIEEII